MAKKLGLPDDLSWYAATRHSFASRTLSRGVPLDEASRAMGHATPMTTRRYYDHFIHKQFSEAMMQPILPQKNMSRAEGEAEVIEIRKKRSA